MPADVVMGTHLCKRVTGRTNSPGRLEPQRRGPEIRQERGVAVYAVLCGARATWQVIPATPPPPGVADEDHIRWSCDRDLTAVLSQTGPALVQVALVGD